jgi:hypothetical protein
MFTTIAIIVVVLLAVLLGFAATKADTFRVERAMFIKARPEKIFRSSTISTVGAPGHPTRNWTPR